MRALSRTLPLGVIACLSACGSVPSQGGGSSHEVSGVLRQTWTSYEQTFIQRDGRVIDPQRGGVTTSEGQSYAMLRATWMNDPGEFQTVWRWTQANLQVRQDHLFGYLWGQNQGGQWTLLDPSSATDADEDIALALVFAGRRWHNGRYLGQARQVIADVWDVEVGETGGSPYLTAGNWARTAAPGGLVLNPSYLSPAAYHVFASLDHTHPWRSLVDTSFRALRTCSQASLGTEGSSGLPPNWCVLRGDAPSQYQGQADSSGYGYDAFRTMWRVALDATWFHDRQAVDYLRGAGAFLRTRWRHDHRLASRYGHDGRAVAGQEDPTVYGGDVGAFIVTDPTEARAVMRQKLLPAEHSDGSTAYFGDRQNYFEQNWVWFGSALTANRLPDLAA